MLKLLRFPTLLIVLLLLLTSRTVFSQTITSFSPASGPAGTLVTINGSNLGSATGVTIAGKSAIIVSNTSTALAAMVMPGNSTGVISITTTSGTAASSGTFAITPVTVPGSQSISTLSGTGSVGSSHQGASIAVSADGSTAVVGSVSDNGYKGAVWIYVRASNGSWSQQGSKLVASNYAGNANQGSSVAISADGDADFSLTAVAGSGAQVTYISSNPAVAIINGTTIKITGAGTTTISAVQSGNQNYLPAATLTQTLVVAKAPLTISAASAVKPYNGLAFNGGNGVTYSGFKNNETQLHLSGNLSYTGTAQGAKNAGTYTIIPSGLTSSNYEINFISGSLNIEKIPLLIAADNYARNENEANPVLTATFSGFVNGETAGIFINPLKIESTATVDSEAGKYPITLSGASAINYHIGFTNGWLTVKPAGAPNRAPVIDPIANKTVCGSDEKRSIMLTGISAGETGQTVTLSVSSSNSKLFDHLSIKGSGSTGEISFVSKSIQGGTATITVTLSDDGGSLNGGVDTSVKTFLITVSPKPSITLNSSSGEFIKIGETVTLTATGGSSYIWYEDHAIIQGQNSATLSIKPSRKTVYTVTAINDAGCSSSESTTINVSGIEDIAISNVLTPNNDGKNDMWIIKDIERYPPHTVKVYDRSGRVVYQKMNYTNDWNGTYNGENLDEGTYFYVIDFGAAGKPLKGSLTIIRNLTSNNR